MNTYLTFYNIIIDVIVLNTICIFKEQEGD